MRHFPFFTIVDLFLNRVSGFGDTNIKVTTTAPDLFCLLHLDIARQHEGPL